MKVTSRTLQNKGDGSIVLPSRVSAGLENLNRAELKVSNARGSLSDPLKTAKCRLGILRNVSRRHFFVFRLENF